MAEPQQIGPTVDTKVEKLEKKKKQHGGKRKGAGMPKGKILPKTLEALKVRDAFNQLVMRSATKLFNAQFNLAIGEQSLFVKYHTGSGKDRKTHVDLVNDPEIIKEYIIDDGLTLNNDNEDEYYFLSIKPSNNMAIDSLLNRALGKVPDKLVLEGGFFSENRLKIEVVGERQQPNKSEDVIEGEASTVIEAKPEAGPSPSTA